MIGALIADRYRLDAPLGAGGMGSVFRGIDERLGRPVAVKLLLPELATDMEAIARFEREARATAKLTHPGIVQILDFGSTPAPSGRGRASYLVLELASGETLARIMEREPITVADAISIGLQMLAALEAAHAAGVVHRDLKPENVMIWRGGDGHVQAKILDFGLAQIKTGTVYTRLTQAGTILGTPRYMAPEQARGETCDARTDVYAVGLVLHAALTGRVPYDEETIAGIVSQVLETVPPRLDTVNASVPLALARAVETAIQKAPAARFASAQAFASALERVRSREPVTSVEAFAPTAVPPPPIAPQVAVSMVPDEPLPPLVSGFPWGAVLGLLGLLAAIGLGVVMFVGDDPLDGAPAPEATTTGSDGVPSPSAVPITTISPPESTAPTADPTPVPGHEHHHHHHLATAPPTTTTHDTTPLIPVCRMAVHCCELVSDAHEACQTQSIGGQDAPPGGSPEVCPLTIRSYHDVLVSQHRDASGCVWPPPGGHALAAPEPPPSATEHRMPACEMATRCCLRTGGTHASCDAWGGMPNNDVCVEPISSYHRVLESQGEDASDCVWR